MHKRAPQLTLSTVQTMSSDSESDNGSSATETSRGEEQDDNYVSDGENEHSGDSEDDNNKEEDRNDELDAKASSSKPFKLSMKKTDDYNAKLKKRGVVYIARIPPRLSPQKLQQMWNATNFGVTRIYFVPEDAAKRKRRRKLTGNGYKRYVEGWIEFADKKMGKSVAKSLNNTRIGTNKRDFHYDDLWNLKYLSKFEWSHLTEKVAYERRVREQRLRLETLKAKKETAAYKELVEMGKRVDQIAERKRKKAAKSGVVADDNNNSKKPRIVGRQTAPVDENKRKATSKAILGSLV